ncbi:hypothetical protein [Isoptericola aurantiacus]|uniref:hypothetical protein n=1 Tax=Isoptericola aurantiacus TaxID=3377839 RepID=UPI00383AB73D
MLRGHCIAAVVVAAVLAVAAACSPAGGDDDVAAAPSPEYPSSSGEPSGPCEVDASLLSVLVPGELSGPRDATVVFPACQWVTPDGDGIVLSRYSVSQWLQQDPGALDDLAGSERRTGVDPGVLAEAGRRLKAGMDLDRVTACEVFQAVVLGRELPDHVGTYVDPARSATATFIPQEAGRHSVIAESCRAGRVSSVHVVAGAAGTPQERMELAVDVATELSALER